METQQPLLSCQAVCRWNWLKLRRVLNYRTSLVLLDFHGAKWQERNMWYLIWLDIVGCQRSVCVCVCVSAYVSFNPPFPSCSRQGPIFSWSPLNQSHAHAYTHFLTKLISLPLSEQLECKTVHMLCYTHTQSAMIGFCDKVLYCAFNVVDSLRNNVWLV